MPPQPRFLTYVFEAAEDNLPEQVEQLAYIMREAADQCELTLRVESFTWSAPAVLDLFAVPHAVAITADGLEEIPY